MSSVMELPSITDQGLFAVIVPRDAREKAAARAWHDGPMLARDYVALMNPAGTIWHVQMCPLGAVWWETRHLIGGIPQDVHIMNSLACGGDYRQVMRRIAKAYGHDHLLTREEWMMADRVIRRVVVCADGSSTNKRTYLSTLFTGLSEDAEEDLLGRLRARFQGFEREDLWARWRARTWRERLLATDGADRVIISGAVLAGKPEPVPV